MTGKHGDRQRMEAVIDQMEIRHLLKAHPYDLSGGEQQRAALAKVLLLNPEVILLDEPTKGMDGFYKKKLAGILKKLTGEGRTILMVSHDIEFCAEFGTPAPCFSMEVWLQASLPGNFSGGTAFIPRPPTGWRGNGVRM